MILTLHRDKEWGEDDEGNPLPVDDDTDPVFSVETDEFIYSLVVTVADWKALGNPDTINVTVEAAS